MESMNQYYDERAEEYDDIYLGKGPASINNSDSYKSDVRNVKTILGNTDCPGVFLDIPSGTAFWMPAYYRHADRIVLVDQSFYRTGRGIVL